MFSAEQTLASKMASGAVIAAQFILVGAMIGYVLLGFLTPEC